MDASCSPSYGDIQSGTSGISISRNNISESKMVAEVTAAGKRIDKVVDIFILTLQ